MAGIPRARIAVISPFIDKRHGTERCVAEQVERLARDYEVHVYSNRVEDVDPACMVWHRVPALPGPHLLSYCWWVLANHWCRWWDRRFRGLAPELVFSPGINCFDADVIAVHIVFAEFHRLARHTLKFHLNPVRSWPRLLHRRIYYRLVIGLERLVYGGKKSGLTVVSAKVARDLARYGRTEPDLPVILHGIDAQRLNIGTRARVRDSARHALGLNQDDFCLLLVGNDWKKKGLPCLLEALGRLPAAPLRLLVVGRDIVDPYRAAMLRLRLEDRVMFLPPRPDVELYYTAADLYVGPSLEDAFGLPPLEAMACGVPGIVSSQAGVSEVITDSVDGLILKNPQDDVELANLIEMLYRDPGMRQRMGEAAAQTARQYTWDRNAEQLGALFKEVLRRKQSADFAGPAEEKQIPRSARNDTVVD
ncbi:MAG TPA: glycosyltransferase family 4 protein [Terriglobia bacterium]|nr:glycosyltransferase family 4 protein [Terriglobia bacterium]